MCFSSQPFVTMPTKKGNYGLCKEHKHPTSADLLPCANSFILNTEEYQAYLRKKIVLKFWFKNLILMYLKLHLK